MDYKTWKRKNVAIRGMRELGVYNGGCAMYGDGLYTSFLSNKAQARQYGKVYFVVNAIPNNPKIVYSCNDADVFIQNLVAGFCSDHGKSFDMRYFHANTTIEQEMIKNGFDGLVIRGRERVNYKPENILYFENEIQLKDYFETVVMHQEFSI